MAVAAGGIYVAGRTEGALAGQSNSGMSDSFVAKYDAAGVQQWVSQLGTQGYDNPSDIKPDPSAGVFITGSTTGGLDGNANLGMSDVFVTKYLPDGTLAGRR